MRANDQSEYMKFLASRGEEWPGKPVGQEIFRCVDHVCSLLVRTIEGKTVGKDDEVISAGEMKDFLLRCQPR